MRNVYEEVQFFYDQHKDWNPVIKREWVESFLRQKAWQGASDNELRNYWHTLEAFLKYLVFSGSTQIENITYTECCLMLEWMEENIHGFKLTLKPVRKFFDVLLEFFEHLVSKKNIRDLSSLKDAARIIAGGRKLQITDAESLMEKELGLLAELIDNPEMDDFAFDDLNNVVGRTVEKLMTKLGAYFQQEKFGEDFRRALFLYTGPLRTVPDETNEDFWLGFWDYFLFDYRLLESDTKPLVNFIQNTHEQLSPEERHILNDLINAQFLVFYINKILSARWVECTDFFTGKKFQLPHPDFDYNKVKNLLFYGHVFSKDMIMVNYVTSIEISQNLRRRIREEVERQMKIFKVQWPDATWEDFFNRHALAVRHTIDILVTQAKVNVTPFKQIERSFPVFAYDKPVDGRVLLLLEQTMRKYGFSLYDITLAKRMWQDYCQAGKTIVRKPEIWAASVIFTYALVNASPRLSVEQLANDFGISINSLYSNRLKLFDRLQLTSFDPRYINEMGFILSLFAHY